MGSLTVRMAAPSHRCLFCLFLFPEILTHTHGWQVDWGHRRQTVWFLWHQICISCQPDFSCIFNANQWGISAQLAGPYALYYIQHMPELLAKLPACCQGDRSSVAGKDEQRRARPGWRMSKGAEKVCLWAEVGLHTETQPSSMENTGL